MVQDVAQRATTDYRSNLMIAAEWQRTVPFGHDIALACTLNLET